MILIIRFALMYIISTGLVRIAASGKQLSNHVLCYMLFYTVTHILARKLILLDLRT